jgi:glycine/D-amino acid oxidase-like deaminating enzyme
MYQMRYGSQRLSRGLPQFISWCLDLFWNRIPDARQSCEVAQDASFAPFWHQAAPTNWQSRTVAAELPREVDVVVIGAGFGGASVAYHWAKREGGDLLVLEKDMPAYGAAGRNAGFLVQAGGSYHGYYVYEPVNAYLARTRPNLSEADRREAAIDFANAYVRALRTSSELIAQTIADEAIDCDLKREGWVIISDKFDSAKLDASLNLGEQLRWDDWVRIDAEEVKRRTGITTSEIAGLSRQTATWHPAKWVWGILDAAERSGSVTVVARTPVDAIRRAGDDYEVMTSRGIVRAKAVVNATEAYSSIVLRNSPSQYPNLIAPYQSQGMHAIGAPRDLPIGVAIHAPLGWIQRISDDEILFGSDLIPLKTEEIGTNEPSRVITRFMCTEIQRLWPNTPLEVTSEWVGSVGQTEDKFPVVGVVDEHRLFTIGGFAGAGSSASFGLALHLVNEILGTECSPEIHPKSFFAPERFARHSWYGPVAPSERLEPRGRPSMHH